MILKGNQRAGGMQLALHLLNTTDNDHVEVHDLSGFISEDLREAFTETYAVSQGTRCKQFLFSLSLNPPETEIVPIEVFEAAVKRIEEKLGLKGQPRALVFHEKKGRRHAHCVWSRIDITKMKAINLSHYKRKLNNISRELFLENNWELPKGYVKRREANPLNVEREEWQQGKRTKQDPKELKHIFITCWQQSDSKSAFAAALREHGLILAKGDRRGFVAVDKNGEVYSISRWVGIKAKEVRKRLGAPDDLPTVDEAHNAIQENLTKSIKQEIEDTKLEYQKKLDELKSKREKLVLHHRNERSKLAVDQHKRAIIERSQRAAKLPKGLTLVWSVVTKKYQQFLEENRADTKQCEARDEKQRQKLIAQQMKERRALQFEFTQLKHQQSIETKSLNKDLGKLFRIDPTQQLIIPADENQIELARQVNNNPEAVLEIITDKEETFTRNDIAKKLSKYIADTEQLEQAIQTVLNSEQLIQGDQLDASLLTTKEMRRIKVGIQDRCQDMITNTRHGTPSRHQESAIRKHNQDLQNKVGADLSAEQINAIRYVTNDSQLSIAIGLAGAGKSTMLAAANDAWKSQGRRVYGAALSGKAADGLQASSNIESRTLASWQLSWENGYNELQPNDVFVIDEAGMVGNKQLLKFIETVKNQGGKLVLVGDPEQLQPIQAGNPLREISQHQRYSKLTEILRQEEKWQRRATLDLAKGHTERAIESYDNKNRVIRKTSVERAMSDLVDDYIKHVKKYGLSQSRIALAHKRKDVYLLNQYIRAALQISRKQNDEFRFETNHGPRLFSDGDKIVFTKNDKDMGVKNGSLGTITKIKNSLINVKLEDQNGRNELVTLNSKTYSSFDHGYALTIHKSQGITVDNSFVLNAGSEDKHLTYVAMTRHRINATLYMMRQRQPKIENFRLTTAHSKRHLT